MTQNTPSYPAAPARSGLPWLLIVGLASLSLLWPLTDLVGIPQGAPRALTLIAVIGATWICVVGFGRVARPVLVLALTGLLHGVIAVGVAAVVGAFDRPVWTLFVGLAIDAFWGAVAGLLALAVQRARKASA